MRSLTARVVAYASLRELVPLYGLYALLFEDHGLDARSISTLFILWSVVAFSSEIPSGAWADTVPRRHLLFGSGALLTAAFSSWLVWPNYWGFAAGFALWGVSESMKSGTFEALVYDELTTRHAQHRYAAIMGYANAGETACVFVAILSAAPLYTLGGYALVGWVSVAVTVVDLALVATLPSAPAAAHLDEPDDRRFAIRYLATVRTGAGEIRADRVVRRTVFLTAALLACLGLDEYFALVAREGGASTEFVPVVVASTAIGQTIGAATAGRGARMSGRVMALIVAGGAVLIAAGSLLTAFGAVFGGFVAIGAGYGAVQHCAIVADARLQDSMSGRTRATVTSVTGLTGEVLSVALFAGFALGSMWLPLWTILAATVVPILGIGLTALRFLPDPGSEDSQQR